MRKLLFICLILFACSKQDDIFCWECNIDKVFSIPGYLDKTETIIITECGLSERDIVLFEKIMSVDENIKTGLTTTTITNVCKCKKR